MAFDHDDLMSNFGAIWPVHVEHFAEFLIESRRYFGGDLDRMLILAIIGSRTLPVRRLQGLSYGDFVEGRRHDPAPGLINVHSISECSGIPRETVRRKVLELQKDGWIEKHETGHLVATMKAARDLAPVTEATFRYLVAIGAACVGTQADG